MGCASAQTRQSASHPADAAAPASPAATEAPDRPPGVFHTGAPVVQLMAAPMATYAQPTTGVWEPITSTSRVQSITTSCSEEAAVVPLIHDELEHILRPEIVAAAGTEASSPIVRRRRARLSQAIEIIHMARDLNK